MKKGLKKVVVLAMAGVMTIAPVMTASAETVVSGGTYQMTFPDRNNGGERLQSAAHQVIVSDVPLRTDVTDQYHQQDIAAEAKAGYEMKGVYFYYPDALYVPDFWSAYAEGSGTWTPTQNFSEYGIEYGGLGKIYTFTVNMNGQDYPDCALYLDFNSYGDYSGYGDYSRCYAALRLPVGYTGNAYFQFYDYNEQGVQTGHTLDYYFSGNGETAAQETTAAEESKAHADPVRITSSEFMGESTDSTISSDDDNEDFTFGVINTVRLANDSSDPSWKKEVDAQIGDKVEFQIEYKNLSDVRQPSVVIRNVLPKSLRYVEGSTYLFNTLHPNGGRINEDTIIANGVNIGNYLPGANAYLRITAEVVGDTMACGKNVLVDWGQGQAGPEVGKQIVLQDYAIVNVYKP